MQRPVMNPGIFEDSEPAPKAKRWAALRAIACMGRAVRRVLFYRPLSRRLRVDDGLTPFTRFVRGLLYRLAFVPVFIALAVSAVIYAGTHPNAPASDLDPTCQ